MVAIAVELHLPWIVPSANHSLTFAYRMQSLLQVRYSQFNYPRLSCRREDHKPMTDNRNKITVPIQRLSCKFEADRKRVLKLGLKFGLELVLEPIRKRVLMMMLMIWKLVIELTIKLISQLVLIIWELIWKRVLKSIRRHVLKACFEACYRINYDILKAYNRSSGGPEGPELSRGHTFMVLRALNLSGLQGRLGPTGPNHFFRAGLQTANVWIMYWAYHRAYVSSIYGAYMELNFDGGFDDMRADYPVSY